jgi:thiamine biosynthesis protein ThiS
MAIKLTVNGQAREVANGATGADLLASLEIAVGAIVAEVNGDVVKREEFLARVLTDGDVLELVTLVGGG